MREIVSQQLWHDQVRQNFLAERHEWCEEHVYKATVRRMRSGVEISVRDVQKGRMERSAMPEVPIHLRVSKVMSDDERAARDAENAERALRYAKQQVRWLLKSLSADHLLTLTFRENIEDIEQVQKYWQRFSRLMRKRYPDWKYVCAQERQERGAWHLHVGIRGRGDVHWIRRCWWMALGHRVEIEYGPKGKKHLRALVKDGREWRYARSEEVRGNIDLRGPSKRFGGVGESWKTDKLAAYMTKYMTKDFEEERSGRRRFWPAKGIEAPRVEKMWLKARDWESAVKECHDMARVLYSCSRLVILARTDDPRIWVSGSEIVCPF